MSSAATSSHSDQGHSPETPAPDLASHEIFTLSDPPGAGMINSRHLLDTVESPAVHFQRPPQTLGTAAIVNDSLAQSLAVATGDQTQTIIHQDCDYDYNNDKTMAPVKDTSNVHMTIKDIIQQLSDLQMQTHGYVPETQDLMVDKMTDVAQSLARLQILTSPTTSPNNHILCAGGNPDIFTRDFVENVQRGNAVINGKQQAFRDFTEIYAKALKEGVPGVSRQVDRVMKNAGFQTDHGDEANVSRPSNA